MRHTDFQLFGAAHLAILALIACIGVLLVLLVRRHARSLNPARLSLASFLILNELIWYAFRYSTEGFRFPEGLPLQLCDAMVWLTAAALLTLNSRVFELAYLIGIAGAGMALLTPDLWAPMASYPSIYFFLVHGGILVSLLMLIASNAVTLHEGCVLRVFLAVNLFAAFVGGFNLLFDTNYMYLCRKPHGSSVLDWFGPWPWYIAAGELLALLLLYLLWLPWSSRNSRS